MKFLIEIEASTPDELVEKLRVFVKANGPIIAGKAEEATVAETTPPKRSRKAAAPKDAPKEEKIECRDKPLTEPEVRAAMIDFVNTATEKGDERTRKDIFKSLLDKFDVEKLADLPADKYGDMVQLVADEKAAL